MAYMARGTYHRLYGASYKKIKKNFLFSLKYNGKTKTQDDTTAHLTPCFSRPKSSVEASSSSEVRVNTEIEAHSPRATRFRTARATIEHTSSLFEEEVDGSGRERGSDDDSRESTNDPQPVEGTEEDKDSQKDSDASESDETLVQFVRQRKADPVMQQYLIDVFGRMWSVPRSRDTFDNGILSKSGGIGARAIIPESRVVEVDVQAFPDIYNLFKQHQFEWMTKKIGEYARHLTKEF
ncbi:hypothetical protein KY285_010298 [Solanum tuberosum]|nr:hypothetical protein KY289_010841 [Solanum tuberosum]KAH0734591.1 hypothetical protein KY285_010298 [Solanum tuberosum]